MKSEICDVSILVADDEATMRSFICATLRDEGFAVSEFDPCKPNPSLLRKKYDVAIVDIVMPQMDGFMLRKEIVTNSPDTQFVFITGHADKEKLDKCIENGVFMFLPKPFHVEHIRYAVLGALKVKELCQKNLEYKMNDNAKNLGLVGNSPHIRSVRQKIKEIAHLEIQVLITGESGTGKEIVAGCIHQCGPRSSKPFIAVNMAGLSPGLIESELFGHVQGAFTGAIKAKHGFFATAEGGTLFLDEIGDLSLELQSKLLRVLDKGEYYRVGESSPRKANVRIVSATNKDLQSMVKEKTFRHDLYYRLRGTEIKIAPLRERKEDIPFLVHHFTGNEGFIVLPSAMDALKEFQWPGNVRELKAVVSNLKLLAVNKVINEETVNSCLSLAPKEKEIILFNQYKTESETTYFKELLHYTGQNISKASKLSGLDRKNLRNKLKALELYKENE